MIVLQRVLCRAVLGLGLMASSGGAEILPPGHYPPPPGVHALTEATVITKPGEKIENGTVVIRDGRIEAAGAEVEIPADARVWDLSGLTVYPGFIDPHLTQKATDDVLSSQEFDEEHGHEPRSGSYNFFGVTGQERDQGAAGPGYSLSKAAPEERVAAGYTPDGEAIEGLHEIGFTAGNIVPTEGFARGRSALVLLDEESPNRSILKADTFQHLAFDTDGDGFPRSTMGVIAALRQLLLDARDYQARREYYEETVDEEYRPDLNLALEALQPAIAGERKVVFEPGSVLLTDRAVRLGREFDLELIMVSCGQDWRRPDFLEKHDTPFIVPLQFPEVPKLPEEADWDEVSLDQLRAWDWAPENARLLAESGRDVAFTTYGLGDRKKFRANLRLVLDRGFSEEKALAALTTVPARLCGIEERLGTIEAGKIANLVVVEGSYFDPKSKVRDVWVAGKVHHVQGADEGEDAEEKEKEKADKLSALREEAKEERRELRNERLAKNPLEYRGPFAEPEAVLVKNATIWTSADAGRLENADLLVVDGKIEAVGEDLEAPEGAAIIDGEGKHVTAGLIDCHSHSMILGGVNEGTLPSTAMVRVGDVVNSETRRIIEQLAGGLTAANLLHGSANPIGGQNCVIKLRDGASPQEMKLDGAPEGIKFALGENVKQANWRNPSDRFPQTRMGVPVFIGNRFAAARQYQEQWREYEERKEAAEEEGEMPPPPPRRNLELDALVEILEGERLIHCHSYRQDEILAFLRLMESFGVQVATLQHVLEGYKVADEIARHGAGASCFSDWWAYKYEVIDAIPYAGALMHERGVLVSFNSDSSDHARRLYTEAAKAVKYGGLDEVEALKFVTINPAKQLRIDEWVGSLEPGKDGDFVLWSRSPLDSRTVCLQTWIDGKKYFDREGIAERTEALAAEREELIEKAREAAGLKKTEKEEDESAEEAFFNTALELRFEWADRGCSGEGH